MSDMITMDDLNEENMAKLAAMVGQTETRPASQQGLPRLAIEQQSENDEESHYQKAASAFVWIAAQSMLKRLPCVCLFGTTLMICGTSSLLKIVSGLFSHLRLATTSLIPVVV